MGRGGPGLFDSDSFWDSAGDLAPMIGVDLAHAGCSPWYDDDEEDQIPVLSVEETAAHLNDGNFNRVFDMLRTSHQDYMLCIFVVLSMRVGAKISKKHIKYIKKIYQHVDAWEYLPECREQIKVGCEEYKSGKPYTIKDFDFGDDYHDISDTDQAMEVMKVGPKNYHEPAKPKRHCPDCADGQDTSTDSTPCDSSTVPAKRLKLAKASK